MENTLDFSFGPGEFINLARFECVNGQIVRSCSEMQMLVNPIISFSCQNSVKDFGKTCIRKKKYYK